MTGTLHILTGKIASGKSSKAAQLRDETAAILLSEDAFMSTFYEGDMKNLQDYVRNSARLRVGLNDLVVSLLTRQQSVVLDFAANTPDQRAWMMQIITAANCPHVLHYLEVPDEVCRARLHARNASGNHPFQVSDEQFDWITEHFVPPHEAEGFQVRIYLDEK